MVSAELTQLELELVDLFVERLDQYKSGLQRPLPRVGEIDAGKSCTTFLRKQTRIRARVAVCDQRLVDAVLQHRAVLD